MRCDTQGRVRQFLIQRQQLVSRETAARQTLHALADRSSCPLTDSTPKPSLTGSKRLSFQRLPDRFIMHALVSCFVILLIWGDLFFSWSSNRPLGETPTGGLTALELEYEWNGEVVYALGPIDAQAEPIGLEQVAPLLVAPKTVSNPLFEQNYILQLDDTLETIAHKHGVSSESLIWANALHKDPILAVGRELRIPRIDGSPYIVQAGDTLESIAQQFQVPLEAIELLPENQIKDGVLPPTGSEIFIPKGQTPNNELIESSYGSLEAFAQAPARLAAIVRDYETNVRSGPGRSYPKLGQLNPAWVIPLARHEAWVKLEFQGQAGWVLGDLLDIPEELYQNLPETDDFPPPPPIWVWPARGSFTSGFGPRWGTLHNGIDIANRARTPIYAARAGTVVEAGWCRGYGYCVRINHGGGIETTYGHLYAQPIVKVGQSVEAGQQIGLMGTTYDASGGGFSTGVHLHFTVKVNGRAVNPLNYLP